MIFKTSYEKICSTKIISGIRYLLGLINRSESAADCFRGIFEHYPKKWTTLTLEHLTHSPPPSHPLSELELLTLDLSISNYPFSLSSCKVSCTKSVMSVEPQ